VPDPFLSRGGFGGGGRVRCFAVTRAIDVLHQDEHVLVVDKPAGLLSVPTPSAQGDDLVAALARQGLPAIAVHRLDREVSGAVVFARDASTRDQLEALFRAHAVKKTYWAMAQGRFQRASGVYKWPILEDGPNARISAVGKASETRWTVLSGHAHATELEVDLVTGRRNQIRLHFAHAGHPLVGERKYAFGRDGKVHIKSRRVALHAWHVQFPHPRTAEVVSVECPLPDDLLEVREAAQRAR